MTSLRQIAAAALLCGWPLTAAIAAPLPLDDKDCATAGTPLSGSTLRDDFFKADKVTLSEARASALLNRKIGEDAEKAANDCPNSDSCKTPDQELSNLFHDLVNAMGGAGPGDQHGFSVSVDPSMTPPAGELIGIYRARLFLNGDFSWLKVVCRTSKKPDDKAVADKGGDKGDAKDNGNHDDMSFKDYLSKLIVGKASSDADTTTSAVSADLKKRGYATFAYTEDHEKKTQVTEIDAYVGFPTPFGGGRDLLWGVRPGIGYQRKTGTSGTNNLEFDLGAFVGFGANDAGLRMGWLTDDQFKSSVWKATFAYTPDWLDSCWRNTQGLRVEVTCSLSLVGDYADIANAGDKAALKTMPSYLRLGGDAGVEFRMPVPSDSGYFDLNATYSGRQSLDGHDADVNLGVFSIGYTPGDKSNIRIALQYTTGRNVTSLDKQNMLSLTLGYRR